MARKNTLSHKVHNVPVTTRALEDIRPPVYHPEEGKKALAALAPVLAAIPDEGLVTIRVDVETAVYAALGVSGLVQSTPVHARFARLPKEEIDMEAVDGLSQSCFATLFALAEARAAGALETEAVIPLEIATEAAEVERRMQTVCEYHLSDDPEISPELDRLRPGVGHRDLANDLLGYARIYDLRRAVVKTDTKHYRPGDAARANELAGVIIQAFSSALTPRARAAYSNYTRSWTLTYGRYEEVRAAGLWLFRKDPARDQRFPSLFTVARPNGGRPRKPSAEEDVAPAPEPSTAQASPGDASAESKANGK